MTYSLLTALLFFYCLGSLTSAVLLFVVHLGLKNDIARETDEAMRQYLIEEHITLFGPKNCRLTIGYYCGLSWYGVYRLFTDPTDDANH